MESWRCKNLVFPRQTRNMAPIVGGTFKTLLHTRTHTHIHHHSSYPFWLWTPLTNGFKPLECFLALEPFIWLIESVVFWHASSDIHIHHKHMAQNGLSLLGNESYRGSTREGGGGGPKRWWCLVCPFQQCRLLALLTHDSVRYVNDVTIPTTNNWQFPSKIF